jgi:hypothetical protein
MPTPVIPSTFNPVFGLLSPDVLDSIRDYKPRYFLRIDQRLRASSLLTRDINGGFLPWHGFGD